MKKFRERSKKVLEEISYPRRRINQASNCPLTSDCPNFDLDTLYSIRLSNLDEDNFPSSSSNFSSVDLPFNLPSNNLNLPSFITTQPDMADALRSTVTLLKTFDGTPSRLEAFINQIDTFHTRYFTNDASQQEYVLLAIKSKITGSAEDFLLTRPDLTTWDEIKLALRQKFSDPVTRANLQQQLIFLTKKNESTQDYIQKLKALVTKINTKICTEIPNIEARTILINQNELTATQNLLANISNELRTLLIVQNPQNLDSAIDIITNYEILTSQSSFKNTYIQNHNQTKHNTQKTFNPFLTKQLTPNHFLTRSQTPNFSKPNYQNYQTNNNLFRTNQPFFKMPFKPQQNTNFNKPFTSQNNQPSKQQYPQPMSGVSIQPRRNLSHIRPSQNPFQPTGKPNFTFQELTHLENENNEDYDAQFDPEYQMYEYANNDDASVSEETLVKQLENFQLQASETTDHA